MHLLPLTLLALCTTTLAATNKPKRGLVYTGRGTRESPGDDRYWAARNTDLSWYYNYGSYQTRTMQNSGQQYVPMLWGAPDASSSGDLVRLVRQYKQQGVNVSHVLGFNEPDHTRDGGGSDISLADAVRYWKSELEPVRALGGVKLGSPATVGNAGGIAWLQSFLRLCEGCHVDFVALHYYGAFDGLVGYVAQARQAFANVTDEFWLTEFALPAAPLEATQRDFNQTVAYLDNANDSGGIARYSYFGSLRTSASPAFTGPNVAFVNSDGQLTEMGKWYLGDNFTAYSPAGTGSGSRSYTASFWCMLLIFLPAIIIS